MNQPGLFEAEPERLPSQPEPLTLRCPCCKGIQGKNFTSLGKSGLCWMCSLHGWKPK